MVEGLTTSATDQAVRGWIRYSEYRQHVEIDDQRLLWRPALVRARRCSRSRSSSKIPVTPAERPYPFPSRTRKSSSPAPKILRGQPFGKIGRRRDFVRPGDRFACGRPLCSLGMSEPEATAVEERDASLAVLIDEPPRPSP